MGAAVVQPRPGQLCRAHRRLRGRRGEHDYTGREDVEIEMEAVVSGRIKATTDSGSVLGSNFWGALLVCVLSVFYC